MSIAQGSAEGTSSVLLVREAIARSPRLRALALAASVLSGGCGGAPAPDANKEILERLDRIDTRLAALERHDRETREARADREHPERSASRDDRDPAGDKAPSPADPFARSEAPSGALLAVAVTRGGWQVQGRTVNEAQLRVLLSGVGSVTVRAEDGASHEQVVELLDLLHEADIRKIAIARFSDASVTSRTAEP